MKIDTGFGVEIETDDWSINNRLEPKLSYDFFMGDKE